MTEDEQIAKQLEEFQMFFYNKIPAGTSVYHIIIQFPYELKTYNAGIFAYRLKLLAKLYEKRLCRYGKNFYKHPYHLDTFFENEFETSWFHVHMLGTFIDKSGTQLPFVFVENCLKKACEGFKRQYKLNGNINYKVQLVPYEDALNIVGYCTKEFVRPDWLPIKNTKFGCQQPDLQNLYQEIQNLPNYTPLERLRLWNMINIKRLGEGPKALRTDRYYPIQTLFDIHKHKKNGKKRNFTKTQRKISKIKTIDDLADVLRAKHSVEIAKNARRTRIKL